MSNVRAFIERVSIALVGTREILFLQSKLGQNVKVKSQYELGTVFPE